MKVITIRGEVMPRSGFLLGPFLGRTAIFHSTHFSQLSARSNIDNVLMKPHVTCPLKSFRGLPEAFTRIQFSRLMKTEMNFKLVSSLSLSLIARLYRSH